MGRRWVLQGTRKLYCLCLMGWKSQKGKRNNGRQNAVGIIFISKIAKQNLSLGFWKIRKAASTLHRDVSEFREALSSKQWLQHSTALASLERKILAFVKDLKKRGRETAAKSSPFWTSFFSEIQFLLLLIKAAISIPEGKKEAKDRERKRLLILSNLHFLHSHP